MVRSKGESDGRVKEENEGGGECERKVIVWSEKSIVNGNINITHNFSIGLVAAGFLSLPL